MLVEGNPILAGVPAYRLADARHTLLEGAARARNWNAYDRHRVLYRSMQERGQTRRHTDCEVLNLDGLVALARGRDDEIPVIFGDLVKRGANVAFLGGRDTTHLVTALLEHKEHLGPCRAYLRMIQEHKPSASVAKMLADVESAMTPARRPKKKAKRQPQERGSSRGPGRGHKRPR